MIRDVLFKAIEEINRYQREMPECYDDRRDEIEQVKAVMFDLQRKLETLPEGVTKDLHAGRPHRKGTG